MSYPQHRMRRLRKNPAMRNLFRETHLCVDQLIYPLFVCEGQGIKQPIDSMKGCFHFSPDTIIEQARHATELGISAILLFGIPSDKDQNGSAAWHENGAVQQAVRNIKKEVPELLVFTDVCLCAYTSHGHCGVIRNDKVDNDATCSLLAKMALSHVQCGADGVAPSDMMDGRIGVIRECLEQNGFEDTVIMSYAAKFASSFYGPFRDAAQSAPDFGDRKGYQLDPADARQAMQEIAMDIEEGADIVMIKPALSYLDIICRAKTRFDCPIAAYNVSGEYMMLNTAADKGLLDRDAAMLEMLLSIRRAGADIIITYFAKEAAKLLR